MACPCGSDTPSDPSGAAGLAGGHSFLVHVDVASRRADGVGTAQHNCHRSHDHGDGTHAPVDPVPGCQ
jgi:hypothetical protein